MSDNGPCNCDQALELQVKLHDARCEIVRLRAEVKLWQGISRADARRNHASAQQLRDIVDVAQHGMRICRERCIAGEG